MSRYSILKRHPEDHEGFAGLVFLVVCIAIGFASALQACGIAEPVHVRPTSEECQSVLTKVADDIQPTIAAIHSMRLIDAAREKPEHIPEWWDEREKELKGIAATASTVGHK